MIVKNLLELPQPYSDTFGLTQDSLKSHVQNLSQTSQNFINDFKDLQERWKSTFLLNYKSSLE